jgi:hypothetical protein
MFEKLRKTTISLVMSLRLFVRNSMNSANETIQLPLGEYSWILTLEDILNICHENSAVIKIRQYLRVICMKTYVHL